MDDQYYLEEEYQHYDQDHRHRYYSNHQNYNEQHDTHQSPQRRGGHPQHYYEDHPSFGHDYYPNRREKQRPTREQLEYEQRQYEKKQKQFQRQLQQEKLLRQHKKRKQQQQQQKHVHESNHPPFHRRGRPRLGHPTLETQIPFDTYRPPHPVAAPQYTFKGEKIPVHQPQQQTYIQQMEQRNKQKQLVVSSENNRNRSKSKKKGPKITVRSSKSPKRNHKNMGNNSEHYDQKKTTAAIRTHNHNHNHSHNHNYTGGDGAGRGRSERRRTGRKRSRSQVRFSKSLESRRTPSLDITYPTITQSNSDPVSAQSSESDVKYGYSQSPKRGAMKSRIYSKPHLLMHDQSYDYNNDGICCKKNCCANDIYGDMGSLSSSSSIRSKNWKGKKGGRKRFNDDPEVDNGCCGAYGSACISTCQDKHQGPLAILGGILLIVILLV